MSIKTDPCINGTIKNLITTIHVWEIISEGGGGGRSDIFGKNYVKITKNVFVHCFLTISQKPNFSALSLQFFHLSDFST